MKRKKRGNKWQHKKKYKKIAKDSSKEETQSDSSERETQPGLSERGTHSDFSETEKQCADNNEKNKYKPLHPCDRVLSYKQNDKLSIRVITGSYGQNDKKFSPESRNKQCTAIAVVALAYNSLLPFPNWNTIIIDHILDYGDRLYRKSTALRNYSALGEPFIYTRFTIDKVFYSLKMNKNDSVTGHQLVDDGIMNTLFDEGFQRIFANYKTALFSYGSSSICISQSQNNYYNYFYLFDSHGHREDEETGGNGGKAFLIRFYIFSDLKKYLCQNYSSASHYSLLPITVKMGSVDKLPQAPPCSKAVCEAIELMYRVIEWF